MAMNRRMRDRYGRGSAAANGEGFVDLAPGDTFDGLEAWLRASKDFYSVEAVEINEDADPERTPRGAMSGDLNSAPLQGLTSQWKDRIAYYVGDVNRTRPVFVASAEPFSVEVAARKVSQMIVSASGERKTDISVIILQKDEALHIRRCLERLAPLAPRQVFVVDCFSTDGSDRIAAEMGATVVRHAWPGEHAKQLNWALDSLPLESTWILRLDADEYLYPETCEEVRRLVTDGGLPPDVTSLSLSRARVFCGRRIRFGGTAHIPMVRFFKRGVGRCQERAMDEHIVTREGRDWRLKGEFADDNLNSMDWWREKHRGYAKREARDALAFRRGELRFKPSKEAYYRMPRYLRAFIYFSIRYFVRLGFLDGYAGWMWNFWQGLWYRWLVDREIGRLERKLSTD